MSGVHVARVYYRLEKLLEYQLEGLDPETHLYNKIKRYWIRRWKIHNAKNPGDPLVLKCAVCSGQERAFDIKSGKFKISTRAEQDNLKEVLEERDDN
jgi:hypothetical protein